MDEDNQKEKLLREIQLLKDVYTLNRSLSCLLNYEEDSNFSIFDSMITGITEVILLELNLDAKEHYESFYGFFRLYRNPDIFMSRTNEFLYNRMLRYKEMVEVGEYIPTEKAL